MTRRSNKAINIYQCNILREIAKSFKIVCNTGIMNQNMHLYLLNLSSFLSTIKYYIGYIFEL